MKFRVPSEKIVRAADKRATEKKAAADKRTKAARSSGRAPLVIRQGTDPGAVIVPATTAKEFRESSAPIPDGLARTLRITGDGTTAVMSVVMIRGDRKELLGAYDSYEQSVEDRGGPDPALLVHVCAPTSDGICVIDVWESESALKAWVARTPGQRVPKTYPVHGMRLSSAPHLNAS